MPSAGIMASAVVVSTGTFPVIATVNTETGTALGSNNSIPLPAGITAGDLLVVFDSYDNSTPPTAAAGWTQVASNGIGTAPSSLTCWARIATGSDALTLSATSQDYAASVLRITGHGVTTIATDIKWATTSGSTASTVNPPNLDAGTSRKWLWLVAGHIHVTATGQLTDISAGYTLAHPILQSAATTATSLGVGSRQNEAQTEDPGVFTNTARPWIAFTVAVPPP